MSILEKTKALRAEAWANIKSSPQFNEFRALDDAVVALGGSSAMPAALNGAARGAANPARIGGGAAEAGRRQRSLNRVTHASAAEAALIEAGEPLPIGRLMEAAIAKGANLSGSAKPLPTFRSALSKNDRFRTFLRNGLHVWWLTASPLPQKWKEAADPDLLNQSAATSSLSQEGGDADAATTLTS